MQAITDDKGKKFINRRVEMDLVREVLGNLVERKPLLATPILNFFGVDGIGKTEILKNAATLCVAQDLPYIYIELNRHPGTETLPQTIIEQVREYTHLKQDQTKSRRRASSKQARE